MNTKLITTIIAVLGGCACADPGALEASSISAIHVANVVDRGNSSGRHYFELYGDFTGGTRAVAVFCGGAQVASRREYASSQQINVSIDELPSGTSCSFRVSLSPYTIAGVQDRGMNGDRRFFELYGSFPGTSEANKLYGLSSARCDQQIYSAQIEFQSAAQVNVSVDGLFHPASCEFPLFGNTQWATFGPRVLQIPDVEIGGAVDRGVAGGEHHFELYGRFSIGGLSVESICGGVERSTRITYSSAGQVNIALQGALPADWTCGFTAGGVISGRQTRSPVFHKRSSVTYSALPAFLGAYYWGGRLLSASDPAPLATATSGLRASGFQTARFILSPLVRGELIPGTPSSLPYGIDTDVFNAACPPGTPFLPCAIRNPIYQQAISQPGLQTIVFSAYDSTTMGDFGWAANYVDRQFVDDHESEIIAEYRGLTLALYQTQAGTGKTFIIANWEGDNHMYCGSAYSYTVSEAFRARCPNIPAAADGLRAWFKARQRGIREGRSMAAALNLTGVHVADGIEFNSFHFLDGFGPSVLNDIIPQVRPEWASYSSWETLAQLHPGGSGPAAMAAELTALKRFLAEHTAGTRLMIGEAGFDGSEGDRTNAAKVVQNDRTAQAVNLFNAASIPVVILWAAQNSMPMLDALSGEFYFGFHEGLYNVDGSERANLRTARSAAGVLLPQVRPVIGGAVVAGASPSTTIHVELYGSFPGASNTARRYRAKSICVQGTNPEVESWITETYESPSQINIALPAAPRTCRFVIIDNQTFTASVPSAPVTIF